MAETDDKGYKVEDRRYLHLSEEEKAKVREEAAAREAQSQKVFQEAADKAASGAPEAGPLPEITFPAFIISLSSSAFISLGAVPDPNTGKTEKNLPLAKQTIDLLGMLREKSRNNLSSEEESLFDHLLHDLRMAYVKEVR